MNLKGLFSHLIIKVMLLSWEAKVLNRIYKTSYFNSIAGMFGSLDAFDYGEVARSYYRFSESEG